MSINTCPEPSHSPTISRLHGILKFWKDLFILFILCTLWIYCICSIPWSTHSSDSYPNAPEAILFGSPLPYPGLNLNDVLDKKSNALQNIIEIKDGVMKIKPFSWIDQKKTPRETGFHIKEDNFKKEVNSFGYPTSMTQPDLLKKKGFNVINKKNYLRAVEINSVYATIVDYQQIFKRNLNYFRELTKELIRSSELENNADPLFTFLTFVQQIQYGLPPEFYNKRRINSFFIPLLLLVEQFGDCDSKSILLSEFLSTYPNSTEKTAMILINGRGITHALLGVKRTPLPGMTSIYDMKKGYYIVMEASTLGWAPGFINPHLTDALKAGCFMVVDLN